MTLVSESIFRQGAHSSCRTTRAETVIGRTLTSSPNTLRRSRRLWREQVTGRTLRYSLSMRLWYQICDTTSSVDTVQRPLD
ncbi:hypothetical protein O6P43_003944 [Quillaja saponaria]|uniref:Uncharacterized protein n=1 Tax=Quillaja saponaria TaxID=32244 RepID=A0AAD7Q2N5_QUISA|nr:hypothetical protein O6P43_003944 [Quillaja saponaria]